MHVPLLMRGPGIAPGTELGNVTRAVDLMPTALDLLGLAAKIPAVSGRSLAPALRGARMDEEATFAESLTPLVHFGWSDLRAIHDGRWKYILAPRSELYDLERDPGERDNLIDREPQRARAYRSGIEQRLREEQAMLAKTAPATAADSAGSAGEARRARLRQLTGERRRRRPAPIRRTRSTSIKRSTR